MVSAATELPRSSPLELWKTRVVSGRGPCQLAEMPRMTCYFHKLKCRLEEELVRTWKMRRQTRRNPGDGYCCCCCCSAVVSGGEGEARCGLISLTNYWYIFFN